MDIDRGSGALASSVINVLGILTAVIIAAKFAKLAAKLSSPSSPFLTFIRYYGSCTRVEYSNIIKGFADITFISLTYSS